MAGYSGTPLIKKLGIKENIQACFVNAPEHFNELLGPLPKGTRLLKLNEIKQRTTDFIHAFYDDKDEFAAALPDLMNAIRCNGMIWISWPKKASRVPTSMTEGIIRDVALPLGLVDVKVCAVDEVWSGLKLVVRSELRSSLE